MPKGIGYGPKKKKRRPPVPKRGGRIFRKAMKRGRQKLKGALRPKKKRLKKF